MRSFASFACTRVGLLSAAAVAIAMSSLVACSTTPPAPVVGDSGIDTGPGCTSYDAGPPGAAPTFPDAADDDVDTGPPPDSGKPVARSTIDDIFKTSCSISSCHGKSPGQGKLFIPPVTTSDLYKNLINVDSTENPKMKRIVPRDPQKSWLVHKIAGSACSFAKDCVGGVDKDYPCGERMPQRNDSLDAEDFKNIVEWIRQGAPEK